LRDLVCYSYFIINSLKENQMAEKTSDDRRGRNGALGAVIIILILLLLLLGALLAWAFMRINGLEDDMKANGMETGTSQTDGLGTGTGVTPVAPSRGGTGTGGGTSGDDGSGTGGAPGAPGTPGDSTTISCPEPSQRVTLPSGQDICVTINPLPAVDL
jgi:hypothetical protein